MTHLSIRALGTLEIALDGEPVSGIESDKVRAMLVFLAVAAAQPHRREKLAALLWPERPDRSARGNLRCALANLRKSLGDRDADRPFLRVTRQTIQFDRDSDAWVDVLVLTDRLSSTLQSLSHAGGAPADQQTIHRLEDAVELYRGEFLQGFSLDDSAAFDEWALFQQEQLHRQVTEALGCLSAWYESRCEWEPALRHAWRQLELDPWRESGHRQVMRLLTCCGQRGAALTQYRACRQVLSRDLGVEPEEETLRLFEQIRDGKLPQPSVPPELKQEPTVAAALPAFLAEDEQEYYSPPVFVAYERELVRLDGLLEKAIGGHGQIVFVVGGPGRGKTALLGQFARRAMDTHPDLLAAAGRCNAYEGMGDPYLPFRDLLGMLTGDVEAPWKAGTMSRRHALRLWNALPLALQTLLQHGSQVIPLLLSGAALWSRAIAALPPNTPWLGRVKERVEFREGEQERTGHDRLFQQVANVLHALAEVHPLLLILDDLQWIDSDSACLLFHLGQRLSGSRILIAGAYRPEELAPGNSLSSPVGSAAVEPQRHPLARIVSEFKRRHGDICLDLSAVSKADARRFVDLYIDRVPNSLGKEFRESLFRRSGGQPLFTIEMLGLMVARRDLFEDDQGRWIQGPALDWDLLPARVEAVIEERISRLDYDLRQLLAIASVEGEEFTAEVLAQATGQSQLGILQRLSGELGKRHRLVRELGVQQAGSRRLMRYRFAHVLFRQYVYNRLSEGERVLMHRKLAGILESLYEGCTEEIAAQLASHYAGDAEREQYYSRLAGERAEAMYAHSQAARYLGRALELTSHEDCAERYAILLVRERAYHRQGCRDLQGQDLADLEALAVALKESQLQAEVALRQSEYERVTGGYGAAIEAAQRAVELARAPDRELSTRDAYCEAAGHLLWAKSLLRLGEYQNARKQLEQALDLVGTIPDTVNAIASSLVRGRDKEASLTGFVNDCPGALRSAVSVDWRRLAADSHRCLGVVCWHLGQNDEARTHYLQARKIYDEVGDLWGQATAINGLGVLAWSLGRAEEARTCFDQSRRYHEEVGDRRGQCRALANLADVATYRSDYAEARRLLGLALPICREIQERWIESGVLNNLGVVADRLGTYDQARGYLQQALKMRREIGDRQGEAESLSDLGLVYHHMGEDKTALEYCHQALSLIRDLGDPYILAFVLTRMGHSLASLDSLEEAVAAYHEALWLRKDGGHVHLQVEPLAGLARVALARRNGVRALEQVEEILHQLNGNDLNGNDEPLRVYLTGYQVLRANGDPRADEILTTAYHILRERAARIYPEKLRNSFLENVATHRDITINWEAVSPCAYHNQSLRYAVRWMRPPLR